MTERAWKFGDVIRVDPVQYPKVPQPDHRRWMIVAAPRPDRTVMWTLFYLGAGLAEDVGHFNSMTGFIRVEDDDEEDDEYRPYIGEFD